MAIGVTRKLYVEQRVEENNRLMPILTVVLFMKRGYSSSVTTAQKCKQRFNRSRIAGRLIWVRTSRVKKTPPIHKQANLISRLIKEPLSSSPDWIGIEQQKIRTRVEVRLTDTVVTTKITHHHTGLRQLLSFWIIRRCQSSCQRPSCEDTTAILINSGSSRSIWRTRSRD